MPETDQDLLEYQAHAESDSSIGGLAGDSSLDDPSSYRFIQKNTTQEQLALKQLFAAITVGDSEPATKSAGRNGSSGPSETEVQQQKEIERLKSEAAAGDLRAQKALERMPLMQLAMEATRLEPWSAITAYDSAHDRQVNLQDRQTRLAFIQEEMKTSPVERNHHEILKALVKHYKDAQTQEDREFVLNCLRKEVQNGNLSGAVVLRQIATAEACSRVAESMTIMVSPQATAQEKVQAHEKQAAALKDLAAIERCNCNEGKNNSAAARALDYLTRSPIEGINPDDVKTASELAKREARRQETLGGDLFRSSVQTSGTDRDQALAQMKALGEEQLKSGASDGVLRAYRAALRTGIASDVLNCMPDISAASDKLMKLTELLQFDPDTKVLIASLAATGKAGAELAEAIASGDKRKIESALNASGADQALVNAFKGEQRARNTYQEFKPAEVIAAFVKPEQMAEMQKLVEAEARQRQKTADDLVSSFLQRDSVGAAVRADFARRMPADDQPWKLSASDSDFSSQLRDALQHKAFLPDEAKLVEKLLKGGELVPGEVAALRSTLAMTGEERRHQALRELTTLSGNHLHLGRDFEPTVKALESLKNATDVHKVATEALAILSDSKASAVSQSEAINRLCDALKLMERYGTDHHQHPLSVKLLREFEAQHPDGIAKALEKLQKGSVAEQKEAVLQIKNDLPDGSADADLYRSLRAVRDLGPGAGPADFARARKELQLDIEASKEEGKINKSAAEWLNWTGTFESVAKFSRATKDGDSAGAIKAVDELLKLAKDGNSDARTAMSALMAGSCQPEQICDWMERYNSSSDKPIYIANFNKLSAEARREIIAKVAEFYATTDDLKPMDATSIAYAISMSAESGENATKEKLNAVLQKAIEKDSVRAAALDGLLYAFQSDASGGKELAPIYLKGINDSVIAKQLDQITRLARQGNDGAIRVLAAIASGGADNNKEANTPTGDYFDPPFRKAQRTLDSLGAAEATRKKVIEGMLFADGLGKENAQFQDRHTMLASLGKLVSQLDPQTDAKVIDRTLILLRDHFAHGAASDSSNSKSALDGLLQMAKHWKSEDCTVLIANLNGTIVDGLRRDADQVPAALRDRFVEAACKRLKDVGVSTQDRLLAVGTMAAFAKDLNKEQVALLASFGGDDKTNLSGSNGEKQLFVLGVIKAEDRKAIKAEIADALMAVIFKSSNAPEGKEGPKELAFAAFRDVPWPIRVCGGERTKYIESRDSQELRKALLNYAEGRPFDINLAEQINMVMDNAKLPLPAAAIMQRMGLGDPLNPSDKTLLARSEAIVRNYEQFQGMSGVEVVRLVSSNIQLMNALPGSERAKLMGWDKLSEAEKIALGWVGEPAKEQQSEMRWSEMTERQKEDYRWNFARINATRVFAEMHGNVLHEEQSINRKLLSNLRDEVCDLYSSYRDQEMSAVDEAASARKSRTETLDKLTAMTKKGEPIGAKFAGLSPAIQAGVWGQQFLSGETEPFESRQSKLVADLDIPDEQIQKADARAAQARYSMDSVEFAVNVAGYHTAVTRGDRVAADEVAIRLWQLHGTVLANLAPDIWRDLTTPRGEGLQNQSILQRLQTRGRGTWTTVPLYAPEEEGFLQALGLKAPLNSTECRGLAQLPASDHIDAQALRNQMIRQINQDPVLLNMSAIAREMNTDIADLSKMFEAGMEGSRFEKYVELATKKAEHIKQVMEKVTEKDLAQMEQKISSMSDALRKMKTGSEKCDPQAISQLEKMIETYKGMHNMLNRFGDPKYSEVIPAPKHGGEKPNPNKQIMEMVKVITDGGMQPSTLTNWFKENALVIGVTILACAATVAACATFGISSPLAVGLWVAVAGLVAREATNEVLYHVNKDGYTGWGTYGDKGSRAGDWYRRLDPAEAKTIDGVMKTIESFHSEVYAPYMKEIVRDWVIFVATAGLTNYFFGGSASVGETLKALAKCPPATLQQCAFQAERAALMAQGESTAGSFMRQFLSELGPEIISNAEFTAMQIGTEQLAHDSIKAISPDLMRGVGEDGQFMLSMAISTAIAMGQGYKHGKLLSEANMRPGHHLEFRLSPGVSEAEFINHMKHQGFEVRTKGPGKWEVLPFNAPPHVKAITMENLARGEGKPPAEVAPPGSKPELRAAEPLPAEASASAKELNAEIRKFSELFSKGDYQAALELAAANLPADPRRTEFHQLKFDIEAYNRASDKASFLSNFMADMGRVAKVEITADGGHALSMPKPVVEINGIKVDMITGKAEVAKGQYPTKAHRQAEAAFETFRASAKDAHQRIVAEQALITIEERIHLKQSANGNEPFSQSYTRFCTEMMADSTEHAESLKDSRLRDRYTLEQEAILGLYDAGWSLQMLEHHFGTQHADVRKPVFEYLRAEEALRTVKDTSYRELIKVAIEEASPQLRRMLTEKLPELIKSRGHQPDVLLGHVEKVRDALSEVITVATSDLKLVESTLKSIEQRSPELCKEPVFGKMLDEALASRIMSDSRLLEPSNAAALIKMGKTLEALGIPADGKIKAALEKRIEGLLATNRPKSEIPLEVLAAVANRFGLSETVKNHISNYNPSSHKGMEFLGRDMVEAFGRRHSFSVDFDPVETRQSESHGPLQDWIDMITHSDFSNNNEVMTSSHKPDNIGQGFFIYNISNNFRIVVHIDFPTGQVRPIWMGTHAEYDRAMCGDTANVRKRMQDIYSGLYGK